MKNITIDLTKSEAKVLETYLLHKTNKLEESGLKDSACYPLLCSILYKINKELKHENN